MPPSSYTVDTVLDFEMASVVSLGLVECTSFAKVFFLVCTFERTQNKWRQSKARSFEQTLANLC